MIKLIEIKGKRYPFLFDMEVVWFLTSSGKIEIIYEENPDYDKDDPKKGDKEIVKAIRADYGDMMELFLIANRSAIEYAGEGEPLSLLDLKNGIRKSPKLFNILQTELNESEVIQAFGELNENGEDSGKKVKQPGTKSSK